jgi:hypothetical protein
VVACIVACGESVHVGTPATLPPTPPPKPPDACVIIERAERVALEDPASCAPPRSRSHVSRCLRAGRGAWGFVVDHTDWDGHDFDCGVLLEGTNFGTIVPRFIAHALYVDEGGRASLGPPMSWSTIEDVRAFDYDGDGVAELLVSATRANENGISEHLPFETPIAAVWNVRDGVVAAYAPAASVVVRSFSDVDGDGRPDLITTRDFGFHAFDGDVTVYDFDGPEWVAHALPDGTFSFADDVASSYVKRSCEDASLPKSDAIGLVHAAACARLRGEPTKKIEDDYVARCITLTRKYESVANAACRVDANGTLSQNIAMPDALRRLLTR